MKKNLFFAAVALVALASCSTDEFIGENTNSPDSPNSGAIVFGLGVNGATRADIYGSAAADLLNNHFYVTGTKGTEGTENPTEDLVIDNYLVEFTKNTAGTTESNTANWEYVGVTPNGTDYVQLSTNPLQTIKYWDFSTSQYDFFAFSTGAFTPVISTSPAATEIGVTKMAYGASLKNSGFAYTFTLPSVDAIKNVFITDITEVPKAKYGQEVTLRFKNLGSKVRIALYETVPGYSVKDVVFYKVDGTTNFTDGDTNDANDGDFKSEIATLISANSNGLPTNGTIQVYFPHVGSGNDTEQDYNQAVGTVSPPSTGASYEKYKGFGSLAAQLTGKESSSTYEADGNYYLGRTLPTATFAGDAGAAAANYYQTVFPVSSSDPLTLRVDYTLVSTDGSGETIKIYGAKAVVPSTYTKWLPNYAYTYIFKISDNTNGWTSPNASTDNTDPGLFPITFDAVVAEATDATGEQTTITTVATPSITTYQQNHKETYPNEYSIATGKKVYVQVMNNSTATASLVTTLSATNSLLYAVSDADATEAKVMDALEKRTTAIDADNVTGRNGITLTKNTNIVNNVTSIVNGPDDEPITVAAGSAAEINIASLSAGTYAYVYDYTSGTKSTVTEYQPITVTAGTTNVEGKYEIAIADLGTTVTAANEAVDNDYIYFSKTTNGSSTTTYSYVSVAGKTTLPSGLIKVAKTSLTAVASSGDSTSPTTAAAATFYFDKYIVNNGLYAVKIIKIVS